MDTTAMKYFMGIASGQTFWDVSENYNISQSSVSKAISKLEDELGVKLFNRTKRSVSLTPAGEIFYDTLKRLEPELQKALVEMAQYSTQKTITLCIVPHVEFFDLRLKLLKTPFSDFYPNVNLALERQINPSLAVTNLAEQKYDFVIGHRFHMAEELCDSSPLMNDTLYVVLPKGNPLAEKDSIDFLDLYKEHFLLRSLILKETLKEICEFHKLPMPPNCTIFEVPSTEMRRDQILSRVAFGQGITLYFESDLYPFRLDQVHVRPVTGCPDFPLVLSWKKGRRLAPHLEAFRQYLCSHIFSVEN